MLLRDFNKLEKWAARCLTEVQQSSSDVFQMHREQPVQLNKLEAPSGPVGGIRSLNVSQQCALVVGGPGACWALGKSSASSLREVILALCWAL